MTMVRSLPAFRYQKTVSMSSMFAAEITVQTSTAPSALIRRSPQCKCAYRSGPYLSLVVRRSFLVRVTNLLSHRRAIEWCSRENADCGGRRLMALLRQKDFSSHVV